MNWKRFFWHTIATFLSSMTCLLWLPFRQVIAIFVSISIAKLLMEWFDFLFAKKEKSNQDFAHSNFCYKNGNPCKYNCNGLCKESC